MAKAIDDKIAAYKKAGAILNKTQAQDEILADASDVFFKDESSIADLVAENRSLGEKILDGIRAVLDVFNRMSKNAELKEIR